MRARAAIISGSGPLPRPKAEQSKDGYYRTARALVRAIADLEGPFKEPTWDPACGDGRFGIEWAKRGWKMYSSDLIARGYGTAPLNYMSAAMPEGITHIVVNPPFGNAMGFAQKALEDLKGVPSFKLCLLQRMQWLETDPRRQFFDRTRLTRVWISSERHGCHSPEHDPDGTRDDGGMVPFAWFVWDSDCFDHWPGFYELRGFATDGEKTITNNWYMGAES